ncbi:TDP-N-acetylfucosamine:lipid II N-acetylfucosaminyltransferase [Thalassotalea euphylliae]|uniref:4-alpha-L-fucosyltransferase n=1 Tax=Thalassotalea euphylliae TaxID=1655234 RepID=A0A3E0TZV4_9GAMM|nr:TDP-N-acetylfucosamine:lipid II N-acetylfucosaminyltransferase [Thalassotalea euphylliae]REL30221.1 hypothetical protein DXX94_05600 [Thalassotalea euphylliae]
MIVHIFADTPHHYVSMAKYFRSLIDKNEEQAFWALAVPKQSPSTGFNYYSNAKDLKRKLDELPKGTRLIVHGNFDPKVWRMLLIHPLTSNASCVFWGADLYRYQTKKLTLKQRIVKLAHTLLCARYKSVVCLNSGDANLVKKYLKRGDALVIPYPLEQTYLDDLTSVSVASVNDKYKPMTILVGNSAAASNNHIEMFNQIKHLARENIRVICTLNYAGRADYIEEVIHQGKAIFGDKFYAYQEMLTKQEHAKLLAEVDVCIFGHDRQQGLFVAYAMFALNKPVFMKSNVSSYRHLSEIGFTVGKSEQLNAINLSQLIEWVKTGHGNANILQKTLTEAALAPQWQRLLDYERVPKV